MRVLKEYPTPWKLVKAEFSPWIEDSGGKTIVTMKARIFDFEVLEFIVETVNNSARPRIIDVKCDCECGWEGIISDCVIDADVDADGDSRFSCPTCSRFIQVIA